MQYSGNRLLEHRPEQRECSYNRYVLIKGEIEKRFQRECSYNRFPLYRYVDSNFAKL